MKKILCLFAYMILLIQTANSHPYGATPFWYPSSYIYGFVVGCSSSIEQTRPEFIQEMWPDQVKSVCGCVIDALRHSLTFTDVIQTDNLSQMKVQSIVNATMPLCVLQESAKKPNISQKEQI
jgi:hypothetical protein